jgi:phage terminase large subunit-like protein
MVMTSEDDFITPDLRHARAHMSDSEYRRKYEAFDFTNLADQQKAVVNSPFRHTMVTAGNQSGKTTAGAFRVACAVLGRYPDWFSGYCPPKPTINRAFDYIYWCVGPTNQLIRDAAQARLLGSILSGGQGQGLIPADRILSLHASRGIAGLVDTAVIRRDDGGTAAVQFRSADMARDALQSAAIDGIWIDEMITDMSLFSEFLARGTATSGWTLLTATPLKQQSLVARWYREPSPDRTVVKMSTFATNHLTPEMVASFEASLPANERKTRLFGSDYSGGGAVLQCSRETAGCNRKLSDFPKSARTITGLDPSHGGLSDSAHPAGVVHCVWDADTDVFYVIDAWRQQHLLPEQLVARICQSKFGNSPVAWGAAETQGSGRDALSYADLFKKLGLKMLPKHATLPDGGIGLDPTFDLMQAAMSNGKLKINSHLVELWDELAGLERDENARS